MYGMQYEILWAIVKGLMQGMSTGDWLKNGATFSVLIFANFVSEGWALLIKTGLGFNSAFGFEKEVAKLVKLLQG